MHIETARLQIRPFVSDDAPVIHRILDLAFGDGTRVADGDALRERQSWVRWNALNQQWHAQLHQPPYGDLAVVSKRAQTIIGAVGYVPCLNLFEQLPGLRATGDAEAPIYATPEVGLFWAIDPAHQGQGHATEAARALIDHAFARLRLKRIVATTAYENLASQRVMRKLGMRLERNPLPEPPWLQVVGVLDNA